MPKQAPQVELPRLVRVTSAAVATLPTPTTTFAGWEFTADTDDMATAAGLVWGVPGVYEIGNLTVPSNQSLDISGMSFAAMSLIAGLWDSYADRAFQGNLLFRIEVGGIQPWEQLALFPTNVAGQILTDVGWSVLNQNVMEMWVDTPVHLVVRESQRVRLLVEILGHVILLPPPLASPQLLAIAAIERMVATIQARFMPMSFMEDVVEKNAAGTRVME
jgi:hypothetical protein